MTAISTLEVTSNLQLIYVNAKVHYIRDRSMYCPKKIGLTIGLTLQLKLFGTRPKSDLKAKNILYPWNLQAGFTV